MHTYAPITMPTSQPCQDTCIKCEVPTQHCKSPPFEFPTATNTHDENVSTKCMKIYGVHGAILQHISPPRYQRLEFEIWARLHCSGPSRPPFQSCTGRDSASARDDGAHSNVAWAQDLPSRPAEKMDVTVKWFEWLKEIQIRLKHIPGTPNNRLKMDVWWNNHFLCKDWESSNWNNHL